MIISGEVSEGDLVEVKVSPSAAAKAAEREQRKKGRAGAAGAVTATDDEDEDWISVSGDGGDASGLLYEVKKGQGPPVAGAEAAPNAAGAGANVATKRAKMETAPSDALTEEEMEDD